jgi:hypothetical protein
MKNEAVIGWLNNHNLATAEVRGAEGGSLLVTSAAARVLRMVGDSGHDFLWLNKPFFEDPSRFSGWQNLGGDRTWIGPERSLFIKNASDPWNTYEVPISLDPGSYDLQESGDSVTLSSRFSLTEHELKVESELSIEKTITPVPNPLRHALGLSLVGVEYIGYQQATALSLQGQARAGTRFGLWHLAQVEGPGEMLLPVTDSVPPHVYFGEPDPDCLKQEPGLLRFVVNGTWLKIGVKADLTLGRAAYLRREDDGLWSLLVRNFAANPSGEYVDTPWDDPADRGYAVQCYADDGKLGNFGELEYHAPAIGAGMDTYTDLSQLWAFRAERSAIEGIAKRLLAVAI